MRAPVCRKSGDALSNGHGKWQLPLTHSAPDVGTCEICLRNGLTHADSTRPQGRASHRAWSCGDGKPGPAHGEGSSCEYNRLSYFVDAPIERWDPELN